MGTTSRRHSPRKQYHVYNRGIDKKHIYSSAPAKYYFKQCIRDSLEETDVSIYSYAIMDNHMHFLLEGELSEIALFMQYTQGRFAYTYNLHHDREGRVFQNVYKSKPILDDRYFWGLIRYIHMNPVKAGLCRLPDDYHFSSYQEYTHPDNAAAPLISPKAPALYQQHFNTPQDFRDFHSTPDIILYDDFREDIEIQIKTLECHALETLRHFYNIVTWHDLARQVQHLPDIIFLLSDTYHFTPPHISKLLNISPYHVRTIIKTFQPSPNTPT